MYTDLPPRMDSVVARLAVPLEPLEKILCEDYFDYVLPEQVVEYVEMSVDYVFENGIPQAKPTTSTTSSRFPVSSTCRK
jgi:hypothetical protein